MTAKRRIRIVMVALAMVHVFACTKTVTLDGTNVESLDGSGEKKYVITTRGGSTYAIAKFVNEGDALLVLENVSMPGTHDTDGVRDPDPPFRITVSEIEGIEVIERDAKATGNTVGLIFLGVAAMLLWVIPLAMSGS